MSHRQCLKTEIRTEVKSKCPNVTQDLEVIWPPICFVCSMRNTTCKRFVRLVAVLALICQNSLYHLTYESIPTACN